MQIGVLGCGNMGGAIVKALSGKVNVCDRHSDRIEAAGGYSVDFMYLIATSDILILALKPQTLRKLYPRIAETDAKIISIAAGISVEELETALNKKEVVRFMPSLAAKCRNSVTAVCRQSASDEFYKKAVEIASSFGEAVEIPESMMDGFIALSGSGIAYVLQFAHAMAMAGTREGIPYPRALEIAEKTMRSAVALQEAEKRSPAAIIPDICSAAGTTIEGISVLEKTGFNASVMDAVHATAKRSKQLQEREK